MNKQFHPYRPFTVSSLFTAHNSQAENYAFASKERDTETGLSYFGARYYFSDLSIWLSVDPMSGKYPHQSNYVYCSNNPIKVIDPNGEDEWDLARDGTLTKRENGRTDIDVVHAIEAYRNGVIFKVYEAGKKSYATFNPNSYKMDGPIEISKNLRKSIDLLMKTLIR